jgi:hypothetical protein
MRKTHGGYPLCIAVVLHCSDYVGACELQQKGAFAMFDRLKSAVSRFKRPTIAEMERNYLNDSISMYDLELRQREVERGLFRKSAFGF